MILPLPQDQGQEKLIDQGFVNKKKQNLAHVFFLLLKTKRRKNSLNFFNTNLSFFFT